MASSSGRRNKGRPETVFGSRFTGLELDCDGSYPSLAGQKRQKTSENILTTSFFNKSTKLSDLINGPKFVVVKRNEEDETATLKFVNPFLIQKAIEQQAGSVKSIQRVRDGTILLETVSKVQAEKLYKLKSLGPDIKVSVYEHPRLNTSRGVVSCFDFTFMTDDEILEGLQDQHVVAIKRFTRRIPNCTKPVNTASAILTFNMPHLPEKVHLAFQTSNVRPFIPAPLRCYKCQKYGHGSFTCRQSEACGKCAQPSHGEAAVCPNAPSCANCNESHPAWSRSCPVYVKEAEIQRIKTVEKITINEARKQYHIRTPLNITSVSLADRIRNINQNQEDHTRKTIQATHKNQNATNNPIIAEPESENQNTPSTQSNVTTVTIETTPNKNESQNTTDTNTKIKSNPLRSRSSSRKGVLRKTPPPQSVVNLTTDMDISPAE